jgi:ferric-dicitrate binding protein FerR (iron transport regulator)
MRNRFFALGFALFLTLAHTAPALAATPAAADWSAVRALSPGEKVSVRTKDGDRLKGRFESASETDISFTQDGRKVTLRRDSIGRVEVGHKNRLKGALVGAAVGGGTGAAGGGYVVARSDHWGGDPLPVGIAFGTGIGAALGAALGYGTNYDTIYQAQ